MATTRLALEIIARNKAKRELAGFQRSVQATTTTMKRFGTAALSMVGIASVGLALKSVTAAALVQETAVADLTAAMRNHSDQSGIMVTDLEKYAAEMQRATIYGDELILSQMAYAKNLGVTTDKLKAAAKAAIGLAAKYRIDLQSAMMLIGRASQGQTQMLTRYGIVLDESLTAQEKFNAVLRIGADSFYLAEEAAKTSAGQLAQFKNTVGDLKEELGEGLLPAILEVVKALTFLIKVDRQAAISVSGFLREVGILKMAPPLDFRGPRGVKPTPWGSVIDKVQKAIRPSEKPPAVTAAQKIIQADKEVISSQRKRMLSLIQQVDTEIELLGRLDEPRQHARMMVEFQASAAELYGANIAEATRETELFRLKLEELGRAQRLQRIADGIGDSFGRAFEDMVLGAAKASEAIRALANDVLRLMIRQQVTEPLAMGISAIVAGAFTPAAAGPSMLDATGPKSFASGGEIPSTGLYLMHRGETVTPAGSSAVNVSLSNQTGIPMRAEIQRVSDRDVVVGLLMEDYEAGGATADMFGGG